MCHCRKGKFQTSYKIFFFFFFFFFFFSFYFPIYLSSLFSSAGQQRDGVC